MFIPTTQKELDQLGWSQCDVILVTGDTYVDSPFVGVSVVGRVLMDAGYRVGIIAQPDTHSPDDIARLGEPALFWGVTGGCIDSMVANYTATKRPKRQDDLTPGGRNDRRPDRAVIIYTNLIKRYFKSTAPIVLGGVEASLRRIAHYDYWSDSIRRSILFDAKADLLLYGMADRTVAALANRLQRGESVDDLPGLCWIAHEKPPACIELPSYQRAQEDDEAFIEMFHTFYRNTDPITAQPLCQQQDTRYLVQNPPAPYLTQDELDRVHELGFERDVHPFYAKQGEVRALDTIRFSVPTHRGCYGECNFCSIAVHQGRTVRWRSEGSILGDVREMTDDPDFKGYVLDVSGPTANMYGFECSRKQRAGVCEDRRCITPDICPGLRVNHEKQLSLLRRLRQVEGVEKVFVASGLRYDLLLADEEHGDELLREIVEHHVSGQMKVAPEHSVEHVLELMGKPGLEDLLEFRERFYRMTEEAGKEQYLTYYLIAAHPGCTERDMERLKRFTREKLKVQPRQVQVFTPTPSTYASVMYHTERNPFTGEPIFVEKDLKGKQKQKDIVVGG